MAGKKSLTELKALAEELQLEASIASSRADIVEANVRRMKNSEELTKLRSKVSK